MKHAPIIAVAPMLDWTDRHCRYFHRLIAPHVTLYTEMVTTGALIHGDAPRYLRFNETEHPLVLQLGGSDPAALAQCAKMGADQGYDEINLNCGCPSDRVQNGAFGACLMATPDHVAHCIEAMNKSVNIPVSIKCRIGIDDCEERPFLDHFIRTVSGAGCDRFTIHARKALLKGLSPKENREVPPLRYDIAAEIKENYPHLTVMVNGGIKTIKDIRTHMASFDSVMIGREAYQNPWFLREIEESFFSDLPHNTILTASSITSAPSPVIPAQAEIQMPPPPFLDSRLRGDDKKEDGNDKNDIKERTKIARAMIPYIKEQGETYATPVKSITRHIIGLFHGIPGGKHWRQILSTEAHKENVDAETLIEQALEKIT